MRALTFMPAAGTLLALLVQLHMPAVADGRQPDDETLRAEFLAKVDAYVELHRRLEAPLPKLHVTTDPAEILAAQAALAREIRTARHDATQGEIFSPPVAAMFRRVISATLATAGIRDMLETVDEENTVVLAVRVNADYPAGASVAMMPPCLLRALPPLPSELQYRFAGRHLILWDVHAGLIADFVPNALREITAPAAMPSGD